jgi:hypothetical protein
LNVLEFENTEGIYTLCVKFTPWQHVENVGVLLNLLLVELSLCGNFIIAADMDMFAAGVHLAVNLTKMMANFN